MELFLLFFSHFCFSNIILVSIDNHINSLVSKQYNKDNLHRPANIMIKLLD